MTLGAVLLIVVAFAAGVLVGLWMRDMFPRKH